MINFLGKDVVFMGVLEQVKGLENGKGIQYLVDSAYEIFDSPLYVIDAFYNVIAFSGVLSDEPFWNELIKTGTFGATAMELMANENVIRDVSYSDRIVRLKSTEWKSGLITGHIFNRDNIWVGETTMSERIPFDMEKMAAFEMLLGKISSEIHDYEYFTKQPIIFFENTINKLLDKTVENTLVNNPQAQIIHYGLENYLYVAVVRAARNNILENVHRSRLAYFQSMLKTRYKSFRYAAYMDHIVMLMSSKSGNFYENPLLGDDYDLFELNNLYAGISGSFENIYELRNYYDQAVAALDDGIKSGSGQRVFLYR